MPRPAASPHPALALLLLATLLGCGPKGFTAPAVAPGADVKAPGNLPVRSPEALADEARARAACAEACAGSGDDHTACVHACFTEHPIEQVEVRPTAPALPAP